MPKIIKRHVKSHWPPARHLLDQDRLDGLTYFQYFFGGIFSGIGQCIGEYTSKKNTGNPLAHPNDPDPGDGELAASDILHVVL